MAIVYLLGLLGITRLGYKFGFAILSGQPDNCVGSQILVPVS